MQPDPQLIDTMVKTIVEAVHPKRIILFGSAARGQMGPDSDYDLLVVMPDGSPRRSTAQRLYGSFWGLGASKDFVVATENDLLEQKDEVGSVIKAALEEGRTLYDA